MHYLFEKYIDKDTSDQVSFYTYYELMVYMSFIPVIWKNKLYMWIPSLIFGVLVVISNYFVQWYVMSNYYTRMTQYILKVLMYIFMIPSLIRYNLFVLVFQYMILSSVNIA